VRFRTRTLRFVNMPDVRIPKKRAPGEGILTVVWKSLFIPAPFS
jgi:hypothetical protein